MFPFFDAEIILNFTDFTRLATDYAPLILASILFATNYPEKLFNKIRNKGIGILIALIVFWWSVYYLSIGINNPFLYFRY